MKKIYKPLMIYDGDCGFCRTWIRRWQTITGDRVDYAPYQEVADQFPKIPLKNFQSSVQLMMPDGTVTHGAEAVFQTLAMVPGKVWPLWLYRHIPGARPLFEFGYDLVAGHRTVFSWLTKFFRIDESPGPSYFLVRRIFLKGLAVIYAVAFISLWTQIEGLLGHQGILPAADFLKLVNEKLGPAGYRFFPTVFWFQASDGFLQAVCAGGLVCSVLLFLNVAPALVSALLWSFYLSLLVVGREFLGFQWDVLLLEVGFLAIFFAPWKWRPKCEAEPSPSRWLIGLYRWLLFRVMFSSGLVKLLSGDKAWRGLAALTCHYQTQPLPHRISWYAHQLPSWFHQVSCVLMFGMELVAPLLFFLPRRWRLMGYSATLVLQLLIMMTGNYCFFNLLTILLCLLLLDDETVLRAAGKALPACPEPKVSEIFLKKIAVVLVSCVIVFSSAITMTGLFVRPLPAWPVGILRWVQPLHIVNSYGLFAVMTTKRPEIIVEGSDDGKTWLAYEFKWKPGDLERAPSFVAPHQPRLDWQMWFAALGTYQDNPWFLNFLLRLLQGSKPVLDLLDNNPFPDAPPRYIRALTYDYQFTDFKTKKETGAWWRRELIGEYCPALSLRRKN